MNFVWLRAQEFVLPSV